MQYQPFGGTECMSSLVKESRPTKHCENRLFKDVTVNLS
jgi:hypothetical protein